METSEQRGDAAPQTEKRSEAPQTAKPAPLPAYRAAGLHQVDRLLDSAHRTLRPLETLFLVGVVLCCTVLCLYVTHSHLQVRPSQQPDQPCTRSLPSI